MKILYAASDQTVPGTNGGSVHVEAVADGLAALGHDVHVLATPGGAFPPGAVKWIALPPPLGRKQLRWANAGTVRTIARRIRPDVIIERYYNFGGEGISAANATGAIAVLEVNAPVIDHAGSTKRLIDRALIVEPMRRWRERICAAVRSDRHAERRDPAAGDAHPARSSSSSGAPTPTASTPGAAGTLPFARPAGTVAGLRRRVSQLARRDSPGDRAFASCARAGRTTSARCSSATDRNCRACARRRPGSDRVVFTGALPHAQMPACLAACDIGVAPFDIGAHRAALARLLLVAAEDLRVHGRRAAGRRAGRWIEFPTLVGHEREGLLYRHRRCRSALAARARAR